MWKIISIQLNLLVLTLISFLSLPFLPVDFNFEPVAYNVSLPPFHGKLAINNALDKGQKAFAGQLQGPESLAMKDGLIYTGTRLGDIFAIDPKKQTIKKVLNTGSDCGGFHDEEKCGRVLGLRFDKNGNLYGIDAYKGLLKIDITAGKYEVLVPNNQYVGNSKLLFGDDLDIDDNGVIYYSQASRKWGLQQITYIILEHDKSGRILTYDTKTKKSGVLVDNLGFPNGIQLTADKKSLLFAELIENRIMKVELTGAEKGTVTPFAENLPGGPDNIRLTSRGTYWVGFESARSRSTPSIIDLIAPYPLIGKATGRLLFVVGKSLAAVNKYFSNPAIRDLSLDLINGKVLMKMAPSRSIVVELSSSGQILRGLHSSSFTLFSEVLEYNNELLIGSFWEPHLVRVPLS